MKALHDILFMFWEPMGTNTVLADPVQSRYSVYRHIYTSFFVVPLDSFVCGGSVKLEGTTTTHKHSAVRSILGLNVDKGQRQTAASVFEKQRSSTRIINGVVNLQLAAVVYWLLPSIIGPISIGYFHNPGLGSSSIISRNCILLLSVHVHAHWFEMIPCSRIHREKESLPYRIVPRFKPWLKQVDYWQGENQACIVSDKTSSRASASLGR